MVVSQFLYSWPPLVKQHWQTIRWQAAELVSERLKNECASELGAATYDILTAVRQLELADLVTEATLQEIFPEVAEMGEEGEEAVESEEGGLNDCRGLRDGDLPASDSGQCNLTSHFRRPCARRRLSARQKTAICHDDPPDLAGAPHRVRWPDTAVPVLKQSVALSGRIGDVTEGFRDRVL